MKNKRLRSTIYLSPENKELLKRAAFFLDKSQADVMNQLLDEKLKPLVEELEKKDLEKRKSE